MYNPMGRCPTDRGIAKPSHGTGWPDERLEGSINPGTTAGHWGVKVTENVASEAFNAFLPLLSPTHVPAPCEIPLWDNPPKKKAR